MVKKYGVFMLLALLLTVSLSAQSVSVSSSVEKSRISLSEQLHLTLEINSSGKLSIAAPEAPKVSGLIYRNVQNYTSSQTTIANGKMSSSYTYSFTYFYSAMKTGKYTLPGFKVHVGSRDYITQSIAIEVVDAPASLPQQQFNLSPYYDPFAGDYTDRNRNTGESVLLCLPESQTVYLGEPAIVSYYLYTNQMVESFYTQTEKDYDGYGKSVFEQPANLKYEDVRYKGERYQRALIKRSALYPQVTGRLQAPTLSGTVQFSGFYSYLNKSVNSSSAWLDVKALPAGKPDGFTGAVGNFTVTQSFSSSKVTLGEALTCTVKITGKGNFSQFTAPEYPKLAKIQISEPTVQDKLSNAIEGSRYIYYTILPQETGEYTLPAFRFSWFDSTAGAYRSFQGAAQTITVKPANVLSYFSNLLQKDKPKTLNPLISRSTYHSFHNYNTSLWFWLLLIAYLVSLLVSGFIAYEKRLNRLDPVAYAQKNAIRILNKYLRQATEAAGNLSVDFYPLAESGLINYLAKKYGISKGLSTAELLETLEDKYIPEGLIAQLEEFLLLCQKARYMPGGADAEPLSEALIKLRSVVQGFSRIRKLKKGSEEMQSISRQEEMSQNPNEEEEQ